MSRRHFLSHVLRGLFAVIAALVVTSACGADETLRIGSKRFTESYVLGELLVATARRGGPAQHVQGLGNTGIVFTALRNGDIHVYPEYSGTVAREILRLPGNATLADINAQLAPMGLAAGVALGFSNGYALGVPQALAKDKNILKISDLPHHTTLRYGLSQEFLSRADGWPGLARAYGLQTSATGLDHGLAYQALAAGRIDVIDVYTTDAKLARYAVTLLEDDRRYFPRYDSLLLYRADVPQRFPAQWQAISGLAGRIDERAMIRMNAAAELEGRSFTEAAQLFDESLPTATPRKTFMTALLDDDLWRLTRQHLVLVFGSLAGGVVCGVPLGIWATRSARAGRAIFAVVAAVQTVPSLALLAFLVAITGTIGALPAAIALFLYALLPIVRNTHAGLQGISSGLRQAAIALGLTARDRMRAIELPLALPTILAGIKTSAVINVGTATIAAFIGAGGYGDRIAAGLALNDANLLLAGAVPAAALALSIQLGFDVLEKRITPGRRL